MTYTLTSNEVIAITLIIVAALGFCLLAVLTDNDGNLRIK